MKAKTLHKPMQLTCILKSGSKEEEQALIREYNANRLDTANTLDNGYPIMQPSETLKQWHKRIDAYYKRVFERIQKRVPTF